MGEGQSEKTSTFINAVDKDLHDNILRLDQKLKGFLTEITVKLEGIETDGLGLKEERKEQLILLKYEIKKAINGIENLVNMVLEEGITGSQFTEMNRENLDALRQAFKQSIEKISKMREEF
ncbi:MULTISPECIES: hypothetical protein [Legionella]|uniref:Coiled-coil protein n=1 Tax=Legionella maceachernii TaxID=466 RepID=A0A0W0VZV5_9GAMM|nr:hypothetical protein [Legionella maceachernii]KTD25513.1 hypothetical protein Lmac_1877 [Legionella maceachernii]SJZ54941.1 hypothetical protein SAMN02745128_00361 [Legionella maceachernii]SUP00386.1 Uncharacterised protein [Legionella maceachernii]